MTNPHVADEATDTPVLRIRDLTVRYGTGPVVLSGIDLDVHEGECLALVGESGCGKTTLARTILGILPKHATVTGTIELLGQDITHLPFKQRRAVLGAHLGYVAQDPYAACDPLRTVRHHINEASIAHRLPVDDSAIDTRVTALDIPDAATRLKDRPNQWSGGMLQRASICAATIHDPELVVADEPTSALDADLADGVLHTIRRASRSVLLISHDLRLVESHAETIAVLHEGRIVETETTTTLIAAPTHDYSRQLLTAADTIRTSIPSDRRDATGSDVVTINDVAVTYRSGSRDIHALSHASLTVAAGEIVGIAGPSGSGKSTLLRIASGIEVPDSGTVRFANGQPAPPRGYVMPIFQDPVASLDRRWPIWRSITEPLTTTMRLTKAERITRARDALDRVRLEHIDPHRLPGQLSVGQCQRVAIARALIARPRLIVADEPTASLDVTTAAEILDLLRSVREDGVAIAMVSHDETLLAALADRVVRVHAGRTLTDVIA
jgi:peptide/nickel transport system ATP-binding protein